VQTGAAALLDTGSNSSVNTRFYDQTRYCLSAVYVKVTEAPVFRSGRCYSYLSLTDFGLTGHSNNSDKIQNTASSFFPLVTALCGHSSALACFTVLRETTKIVKVEKVHSPWLAGLRRAFPAHISFGLLGVGAVISTAGGQRNYCRAGAASQAEPAACAGLCIVAVCQVSAYSMWLCGLQHRPTPSLRS